MLRRAPQSRNPPVNPDESGDKAKPKKRRKRKADSQTTDTRRLLELQSKRALLSSPQLGPRSSPTPQMLYDVFAQYDADRDKFLNQVCVRVRHSPGPHAGAYGRHGCHVPRTH